MEYWSNVEFKNHYLSELLLWHMSLQFVATLCQEMHKCKADQKGKWLSKLLYFSVLFSFYCFVFEVNLLEIDVNECFMPDFYISAIKASLLHAVNGNNSVVALVLAASEIQPSSPQTSKTKHTQHNLLNMAPTSFLLVAGLLPLHTYRPSIKQKQNDFKDPSGLDINIWDLMSIAWGVNWLSWMASM